MKNLGLRKSVIIGVAAVALLSASGCEQKYELGKSASVPPSGTPGDEPKTPDQPGNPTGPTATTDTFNIKSGAQKTKVDVLFVIDNSGSMADEQTALANAFSSFITKFVAKDVDYHIGITSTDSKSYASKPITDTTHPFFGYHNPFPQSNSTPGTLLMRADYPVSPKFLSPVSGNSQQIVDMFKANAKLGTKGSGEERVIYNSLLSLASDKLAADNASFRRSDALISIIGVTDENEDIRNDPVSANGTFVGTESTPQQRIDRFKAYMPVLCGTSCPGWRVDLIVDLNAAARDTTYPLVAYSNNTYPYPDFYKKFAAQTGSNLHNIYSADWGTNLANIASGIIEQAESKFKLSYAPLQGSLKVYLNNVEVAADASNGYVYDSGSQSIELKGSALAGSAGKVLKIEYLRN